MLVVANACTDGTHDLIVPPAHDGRPFSGHDVWVPSGPDAVRRAVIWASAAMASTLTVLICTHNRADLLARTLHYLNEATRPRDWSVDVFVVANACTDATHDLIAGYSHNTKSGIDKAKPTLKCAG